MAHIHEKIDFTVEVFVVYKNRVLLRLHEKYGIWLSIGGHIELSEDPNEAALREVKEEVGLDVILWKGNKQPVESRAVDNYTELIPPMGIYRHKISDAHEHVALRYFATTATIDVVPENLHDQWKWVTKDEMQSMNLLPDIKFYAELALDTLGE